MSRFSMDWSELSLQVMITFGHFLWQACVIGIVLFIAQHVGESLRDSWVLRRRQNERSNVSLGETDLRGANLRYTIACVAFFSLPICVIATFAWVHQSRGPILLVASEPVESLSSPMATANNDIPTVANSDIPVLPPSATPLSAEVPVTEPIDTSTLVVEPQASPVQRLQAFAPYLLLAYIVGVGFMWARFSLSIIGSSRLRRTIQPITDVKLLRTIAEQCARVGLKRVPLVALCQRVSVPVVVGIVKPMILLPPALLCGLDPNQIAAILSHEIAHIRRYDLIVNLLQRIVEALLFFHPVTWWISRRVSIERENCCDDVAAACMGRLPYAGALLQMAELCIGNDRRRSAALASLSAAGSNSTDLGCRIRRLIGAEETARVGFTRRSFSIGLAMISLLTISLVAWGQSQKSEDDAKPEGKALTKVFTPEPLWQTKLTANDVAPETLRLSPVVVAGNRVLSIEKDFALSTGKEVESTFVRLPRKNVFEMTLDPVFRRTSCDRDFLVEVSVHGMGKVDGVLNYGSISSCDIRVLRATDGGQVGTTIHLSHFFDGITSDVDVENGGDFLVIGAGNEVQVYRTTTGQVETTMPVKTKRIDAVAISPDREWLVASDQNDLHFWRWRDQAPVKTIHMGRKIDSLVFTPNGQYLAEGPDTREDIQIRDMRTLEIIASLKDEVGSPLMVSSMDITPNGRYLVAHNEVSVDQSKLTIPHRIHVWDLQLRGKPVFQIATGEWVRKVQFSDDGRIILGEFSGAAHGALLAAWQLPNEILQRVDHVTGALKGRIALDGVAPLLPKLRVRTPASPWLTKQASDEERKKYEASLVEIDDESIQVDADQGLANAFVYLAKAPSNWQPTKEDLKPFTLKMQDERFAPRAAIIRTGQDVRLNNSSIGADNFAFETRKNDGQNRAVGARAQITLEHPFTIAEQIPIQAESQMHPWKTTFLLPLDHSFAAITDSHGNFSIEGLPPGEHSFLIWHERTGWLEKSLVINIGAGQTTEVDRSYSVERFRLAANKNQTDISQQSGDQKPDSSKQSFKLINGETGKPLQGLKCQAISGKQNALPRYHACTTDEHGIVEVVIAKDESAGIDVPSGWFSWGVEQKNQEPTVLKLWRATAVDGRLLWPDKTPAAGVRLTAGVYINHQAWKEKLGMDLNNYSFDHGDWPNWSRMIVTDDDGKFRVAVPPKDARLWFRIGTTQLGFSPQTDAGENEAVSQRLAKCVPLEIQYGGNSRSNELIILNVPETDDVSLHTGDLQLETGVIVRGRVVDAEGKGLSNVHLTSTGPHGPHSGRSASSGEDGKFEFPAKAAGNLTLHPDARLRDLTKPIPKQVISRDVQAVFVDQSFTIPSVLLPHEITVRAVPHTEVAFEWVDRRADKTQPIAYYGRFSVRGHMPDENGKPATYWTSETERVERDGKQWLTVKIPTQLLKPDLMLAADSKVTASYRDSTGVTSGPGIVELGDITANTTRTIFGDEPLQPESPQAKK